LNDIDQRRFNAYYTKMAAHLNRSQYNVLHRRYPEQFPSLAEVSKRVAWVSGITTVRYDCCINSCMAYTGPYEHLDVCKHCTESRFKSGKKPRRQWQYLPLIPQLQGQYGNVNLAKVLGTYRASQDSNAREMSDVFQGRLYRALCERYIEVNGKTLKNRYFDSPRDISLGLSMDGFSPFK
ncbi:hypothetical protein CALVIDRAFT_465589, partial [Calocera viscosa TUFC12733]